VFGGKLDIQDISRNYLVNYLSSNDRLIYIISPFINSKVLESILSRTSHETSIVIVTSWREDYLLSCVSDIELYPITKMNNCTLYINNQLHGKLYSNSLQSAWVGSANLTKKGLGIASKSNIEFMHYIDPLTPEIRLWIYQLISKSIIVTDSVYNLYKEWIENQEPLFNNNFDDVKIDIELSNPYLISQLPASKSIELLWEILITNNINKFEWEDVIRAEHDIELYEIELKRTYDIFLQKLTSIFFSHPFISEFAKIISSDGIRFGAVKEWIQNHCTNVPTPYRRDLTSPTQILYHWFPTLAPEKYEVIRPRHSEILRLK